MRLEGHKSVGRGLDWNSLKHNLLVSGADEICIWDIEQSK